MRDPMILDHPLARVWLTVLRNRESPDREFRRALDGMAALLLFEATRDLPTDDVKVETPLETTAGHVFSREIVLLAILRAGLGLCDPMRRLLPDAAVGMIGLRRNEQTHVPEFYYEHLPPRLEHSIVLVADPMLATGGSSVDAITRLKSRGAREIRFIGLVGAPEGVRHLSSVHPDVPITLGVLDRELDGNAMIRPGLGDAGDRIFGTHD